MSEGSQCIREHIHVNIKRVSGFLQRWDCLQYQRNVTEVGIQILRYLSARFVVKWFLTWCFANELCSWPLWNNCVSHCNIEMMMIKLLRLFYCYDDYNIIILQHCNVHESRKSKNILQNVRYIAAKGAGMPQIFIVWSVSSHPSAYADTCFSSGLDGTYKRGTTECDYLNSWRHTIWGDAITTYLADRFAQNHYFGHQMSNNIPTITPRYCTFDRKYPRILPHQHSAKDD